MILRSLESIKRFFYHNLYQRVSDYGAYHKHLHLDTINANPYIITSPEYNIHSADKYTDPNRAQYVIDCIESLDYTNIRDLNYWIQSNTNNLFNHIMFSKGIDRIECLISFILDQKIYVKSLDMAFEFEWFNGLSYNHQIMVITMFLIYSQVFSDSNHRMGLYLLNIYIPDYQYDLTRFIDFVRSKQHFYMFGHQIWVESINKYVGLINEFEEMVL